MHGKRRALLTLLLHQFKCSFMQYHRSINIVFVVVGSMARGGPIDTAIAPVLLHKFKLDVKIIKAKVGVTFMYINYCKAKMRWLPYWNKYLHFREASYPSWGTTYQPIFQLPEGLLHSERSYNASEVLISTIELCKVKATNGDEKARKSWWCICICMYVYMYT